MNKTVLIALLLLLGVTGPIFAKDTLSTNAGVSFWTNYMWRGQKLSSRGVMNPDITVSNRGFSFNIWQNYDMDTSKVNETDYTLGYNWDAKHFSFGVGFVKYTYPSSDDTREFYGTLTHKSQWNPSITFYRDDDLGNGNCMNLGISHSWSAGKQNTFNAGANVIYNMSNTVLGTNKNGNTFSGFYNAQIDLSFDIPVNKTITITPRIGYSLPLTDEAKTAISGISFGGDSKVFYGGISIAAEF